MLYVRIGRDVQASVGLLGRNLVSSVGTIHVSTDSRHRYQGSWARTIDILLVRMQPRWCYGFQVGHRPRWRWHTDAGWWGIDLEEQWHNSYRYLYQTRWCLWHGYRCWCVRRVVHLLRWWDRWSVGMYSITTSFVMWLRSYLLYIRVRDLRYTHT